MVKLGKREDARLFCVRSHCLGEFVERSRDPEMTVTGVDAEFVVTAVQVLHEGVTVDDHAGGLVGLRVRASAGAGP